MDIVMFSPLINNIPESADPEGSVRYCNVTIAHEKIECPNEKVTFYDDICKSNTFIIEDKSPNYVGYECHWLTGVVVRERNGDYTWWKNP